MIIIHTDGGARGNPGPAAIGIVIESQRGIQKIGKYLGTATNNVAEYTAILEAFGHLSKTVAAGEREDLQFYLDSQLVQRQLSGIYKIKDQNLKLIFLAIKKQEREWGRSITYAHVPREQNREADKIVNQTLDQQHR